MRASAAILACLLGCASSNGRSPEQPGPDAGRGPSLVVVIVLDQLPLHAVAIHWDALDEDGLLRSATARHRVRFAHAGTNTAPGHASVHTGVPAAVHGVIANDVWSEKASATQSVFEDGEHVVFGREGAAYASPSRMRAPTVGDRLREVTGGKAAVVSLAIKRRAAIASGGLRPTMTIWYEPEARRFTTSSYYAATTPPWLATWGAGNPVDRALVRWQPLDAGRLASRLGPDDASGEANWRGFGTAFPHDPTVTTKPHKVLVASPHSTAWLLDLVRVAARRYRLGRDEIPDLLAISVSATDYIGHVFGVDSWEYLDNLIRTDRMLAVLVRELEATTSVAVLVTSDHGAARLPERGGQGGRIVRDELAAELDGAVDAALGEGDWVPAYVQPFVYFSAAARERRAEVTAAIAAHLDGDERVYAAYDARDPAALGADPIAQSVLHSLGADPPGDLFVVPARGFVIDPARDIGRGTGHGTPWSYDTDVPVFISGAGVAAASSFEPVDQSRVAATIAALLGIEPPAGVRGEPLPGVRRAGK